MHKFIEKLSERLEIAKSESDFTYFFNLLIVGEALTKLITLTTAASLKKDKDRHQYKILYDLVRANGIGDWSKALDELLVGTASQYLPEEFRSYQTEMTKKASEDDWQYQAVNHLQSALRIFNITEDNASSKKELKLWFKAFTELRNKTRGHGATMSTPAASAAVHLECSIRLIIENLSLLQLPSAYIKRNMSGKYRVTEIFELNDYMASLKSKAENHYDEGIYIYLGKMIKLPLIKSTAELSDFYISNGGYTSKKYEMLSYITDNKIQEHSEEYTVPKGKLPPSESEGLGELRVANNCFSNVPYLTYEYINRPEIEKELFDLLINDRHLAITLLGRGGIGKTSLALKVITQIYEADRFDAIIWFSSRDIDLSASGAKLVSSDVITMKDIAKYYTRLLKSKDEYPCKGFDELGYFESQLGKSDAGSTLFIFDNFETIDNPIEMYKWLDTYVRFPNKIMITTRLRDFKGDYPLQVYGMSHSESMELIQLMEKELKIKLSSENKESIYKSSAGHPYIIKILIGGFVDKNLKGSFDKIIAGSDEVLTALFERTYSVLSPCAQRIFLTLSAWNSAVPRLGIESILMNSIDEPLEVEESINTLVQYSLAEEVKSSDGTYFLQLPYVAFAFGRKKLKVSPLQYVINNDVQLIRKFGVSSIDDKNISFKKHFTKFISEMNIDELKNNLPIVERICLAFNDGWKILANWSLEINTQEMNQKAMEYITRYLENENSNKNKYEGWYISFVIAEKLESPYQQILALTNVSTYSGISIDELSNIVNSINNIFKKNEVSLDEAVKNQLLEKILNTVYKRRNEADANGCSRFAWLSLHLNDQNKAKELIELGLQKDSDNEYCLKLKRRLNS